MVYNGRILVSSDEDGLNIGGDWSGEDGVDLEVNEESEGYDDSSEVVIFVVGGCGKVEVEVSEEGGGVVDEDIVEGEDRVNEVVL